uniref:Putative rna polymerase i transcription factor uaf n=1 Tax=Hyalomma excavatum TaxID=257692 RepID=A0A131XAY6_9ACAR
MAEVPVSELRKAIAEMLEGANLDVLSSKKIRLQLEAKYAIDFSDRKKEIDGLVMELISEPEKKEPEKPKKSSQQNGAVSSTSTVESSSSSDDDDEQDDEELARKLQDEEFKSRSRAVKKSRPAKKEPTKKAAKTPGAKRESAYSRKCALSPELAAVVGAEEMARSAVVKKMWSIVRERNLFDPSNKQFAICDAQLMKVFGHKRVRMFGMMKYLKNHIKDIK